MEVWLMPGITGRWVEMNQHQANLVAEVRAGITPQRRNGCCNTDEPQVWTSLGISPASQISDRLLRLQVVLSGQTCR